METSSEEVWYIYVLVGTKGVVANGAGVPDRVLKCPVFARAPTLTLILKYSWLF
jgi:hypothetical protein